MKSLFLEYWGRQKRLKIATIKIGKIICESDPIPSLRMLAVPLTKKETVLIHQGNINGKVMTLNFANVLLKENKNGLKIYLGDKEVGNDNK